MVTGMQDPSQGLSAPPLQKPGLDYKAMYEQTAAELQLEQGRRSGLDKQNRGYDQKIGVLETQMGKLVDFMGQLAAPVAQPPQQQQVQTPATEPPAPESQVPEALIDMQVELAELRAVQQRGNIIAELSKPGQPGEGIDWTGAEDYLPLSEDAAEMRESLSKFAEWAKQGQGQAASQREQALLQGLTPGSSPAPSPGALRTPRQEFEALHQEVQDTHKFRKLPKEEQDEKYSRYLDLGKDHGYAVSSEWSEGWDTFEGLRRAQNQILRRLDHAGVASIEEIEHLGSVSPVGGSV